MIRTAIFGASGHGGGELIRLIDAHPELTLAGETGFSSRMIPILHLMWTLPSLPFPTEPPQSRQ